MRMQVGGWSKVGVQNIQYLSDPPPPNLELLSPAILFKMTWRGDTLDNVYLTYLAFASFPLSPSVLSKTLLPHLCYSSAI